MRLPHKVLTFSEISPKILDINLNFFLLKLINVCGKLIIVIKRLGKGMGAIQVIGLKKPEQSVRGFCTTFAPHKK